MPSSSVEGDANPVQSRSRGDSKASSAARTVRSLSNRFDESTHPGGFMGATGELASSLFAVTKHRGRRDGPRRESDASKFARTPPLDEAPLRSPSPNAAANEPSPHRDGEKTSTERVDLDSVAPSGLDAPSDERGPSGVARTQSDVARYEEFENGYHFPPKYDWKDTTKQVLYAFWKYSTTPLGFCVVVYGLNVVAWGGMLFLLLCNASPAMCHPTCNDINSPRRKWIEWDSQILNALFCVTGFGLAPWRFRDWYYLLQYRILKKETALRRLAGIHRGWFRLPGSQELPVLVGPQNIPPDAPPSSLPYPEVKIPDPPLTGVRAPPTAPWKLDFVVWCMVGNTFLQAVLSGFMWGLNRYDRPSWSTGLFVALACIVAALGGIMMFIEGKRVKGIEGVPVTERDLAKLARDRELGILHYNNIKDKRPKDKVADPESTTEGRKGT
ncbi:hypothetical protein VTK73DRAFT_8225 [Phialemonium thermophilum]|uniref:Uncharacterized protein n=1 Tax=Phialemonium thermophilum TaxID=223376 RepID=A0ABR3W9M7_9PEZI